MDQHRSEFDKLIEIRIDLNERIITLENTLSEMKNKYKSFTQNNYKKIYLYSLDSFFFQYKILQVEHEHYKRFLALINHRMYGDYYKLYVIIGTQCKESNLRVSISIDDVLVYKDLDPTFEYTIDDVKFIFGKIVDAMEQLHELHKSNNDAILANNSNNAVGFSIAAFFTTMKYENIILNEQINMYLDFINFYQSSQMGHFSKALTDITRFSDEINGKILVNYQVKTEALAKSSIAEPDPKIQESKPVVEEVIEQILDTVVEEPAVEEPAVEEPAVEEPDVKDTVVEKPVVEKPVVQDTVVEEPAVEEPDVKDTVVEKPVVQDSVVQEPIVEEPVVEEPVVEEPVVEEPVVEEPVVEEPVVEEPVKVIDPVAEDPVVEEPVKVQELVIEEPVKVIDQDLDQAREPITGKFKELVKEVVAKPKNNTPKSRKKTAG